MRQRVRTACGSGRFKVASPTARYRRRLRTIHFLVCAAYSWKIDGELFLPEVWFSQKKADPRQQLGVPQQREFKTKIELGWQMIARAKAEGVPFAAVGCDTLYGRALWLRRQMDAQQIVYMADVPADTHVFLSRPQYGVPTSKTGRQPFTKARVLSEEKAGEVRSLIKSLPFARIRVRAVERGFWEDEFAPVSGWTATGDTLST